MIWCYFWPYIRVGVVPGELLTLGSSWGLPGEGWQPCEGPSHVGQQYRETGEEWWRWSVMDGAQCPCMFLCAAWGEEVERYG